MKVALGADHGGFELKRYIAQVLRDAGHEVLDLGAHSVESGDDYPDYARAVGRAVVEGKAERGILVCGSGAGAAIAASKMRGIRAALSHDTYTAHQMVEHDNANVCCLGARVIGPELAAEIVKVFVEARFTGEERHVRRLAKVAAMEEERR
ncbi:MAG: ribose 5-phosphate isomerase B [Dehalococcoidia bacterium]|nr:ribose 5-phosphate isomerase B [Dehalococcoidia bacterium]